MKAEFYGVYAHPTYEVCNLHGITFHKSKDLAKACAIHNALTGCGIMVMVFVSGDSIILKEDLCLN